MENNDEKIKLLLQVNISASKKSLIGTYIIILGCSMAMDSLPAETKEDPSVPKIYLSIRKIALRMRQTLIDDLEIDENELIEIEQQIFNIIGTENIKNHLQQIKDEIGDI